MKFRPCIDIHNGRVKQIVGSSLKDEGDRATENFVSEREADFFADFFREQGLDGGHVILLNKKDSPHYEETYEQALKALRAYPGGFGVGGGITTETAEAFLRAGASHVIVTSFLFDETGRLLRDRLKELVSAVGAEHIIIDLSCKKRHHNYYVMMNRWQDYTREQLNLELLMELSQSCSEFLVHGTGVEGKNSGIDEELVEILSEFTQRPVTYAGGVSDYDDILKVKELGKGHVDLTIGSALDLYGGPLNFETVLSYFRDV